MSKNLSPSSIILEELIHSKETGNLVAIWTHPLKGVCLAAVDDIQPVEITDDKLIILKKNDPSDRVEYRRIPLSEIERVVSFNELYNEHLVPSLADDYTKDPYKIRKEGQSITFEELKIIFIRNINCGRKIEIRQFNCDVIKTCYVTAYLPQKETALLSCELNDVEVEEIALSTIEEIAFEFYFHYNGIASINFRISQT